MLQNAVTFFPSEACNLVTYKVERNLLRYLFQLVSVLDHVTLQGYHLPQESNRCSWKFNRLKQVVFPDRFVQRNFRMISGIICRLPISFHFITGRILQNRKPRRTRGGSNGTGAAHKGNMILSQRILQCNLVVILCGKILVRRS